jgi:hypothetical protein
MKQYKELKPISKIAEEDVIPYSNPYMLTEAVHEQIQAIMDNENYHPNYKLNMVVKTARKLIADNQPTGFESDKPKKGSSRAVFFPTEPKKIKLDGQEVEQSTAVKIAFMGEIDKKGRQSGEPLLGELQNRVENDWFANQHFGIIRQKEGSTEYETNHEDGILAPVLSAHPNNHHLEMVRANKISDKHFRDATKNKDFPRGPESQRNSQCAG